MPEGPRYRVESTRGEWRSAGGPDYECEGERFVVDARTEAIVLRFEEWGDWPFMLVLTFKGAAKVGLGDDGLHVIVRDHDGSTRAVLIPGGSGD